MPVLMRGSMMDGEIEFAYVDGSAGGAPYVELARIGPQMQEFYDAVKEAERHESQGEGRLQPGDPNMSEGRPGHRRGGGSLGEATAAALRELGFRVLTTTRHSPVGGDTHPLELSSRESVTPSPRGCTRPRAGSTCWSTTPASTSTCARSGASRSSSTAHEVHWRTNYLGTAQLTRLLLPLLLGRPTVGEARVVNVVSKLHDRGRNEWLDGDLVPYDSWAAYGTSKLALVHEAAEIERRYGDRGVHGYSLHPGALHPDRRPRSRDRTGAREAAQAGGPVRAPGARDTAGRRQDGRVLRDLGDAVPRRLPPCGAPAEPSPEALGRGGRAALWDATDRSAPASP